MPDNRDYKSEVIILKWVKLGESDVILKMVDRQGCLLEAVARGARKPKNSTSSKLEQFNCIEIYLAKGRGLDIVKDCKIIKSNSGLREDPCKFACASCLSELLCKTLQENIDVDKVFDLMRVYLDVLASSSNHKQLCLTSATLLKAISYLGYMPSFNHCVICGDEISENAIGISYDDGGAVCASCKGETYYHIVGQQVIDSANAFLHMTLKDISESLYDDSTGADVLNLAGEWIKVQTGVRLRSLPLALEICSC